MANAYYVYLLECTDKSTYVGATVDLDHRLRQHNKELAGGARATSIKVIEGHAWERVCHITGFPNWTAALQFEWAFKHHSRKWPKRMYPLERRMRGLHVLMHLDRPTSKAADYSTYPTDTKGNRGPNIIWESEEAKNIYERIENMQKI
jgi:structure-specific endonuclease subunit SLX1